MKISSFYKQYGFLILALIIGIALRISFLIEIQREPWFHQPLYDPLYNHYWAKSLVTHDWSLPPFVNDPEIRSTPHGRPPGYPYVLALIYLIFGINPTAPRVVQYTLGIANIGLAWLLVRRFCNLTVANIVALLMATFWGFIYYESQLSYPVFAVFLILVWTHFTLLWIERPLHIRRIIPFLSGVILGCFALFRPNGLLLLILYGIPLFQHETRHARVKLIPIYLSIMLGVAIPIVPGMIRNYYVAHDFVFISSYGGLNFYVGNHPHSNGAEPRIPELQQYIGIDEWSCFDYPAIVRGLARTMGKENIKFSEANRYFYKKAFTNILQHPIPWLRLTAKKCLLFWGPTEITNDTVPEWDKFYSKTLRFLPKFPIYLAGAMTALLLLFFSQWKSIPIASTHPPKTLLFISLTTALTYFLSVLPFFIASRYRIPVMPFLIILAGYAIYIFLQLLRDRRPIVALTILLLASVSYLIARMNHTGYVASPSTWFFRQGVSASLIGDDPRAKHYYQEALRLDPQHIFARVNLSQVYARLGMPTMGVYVLTENAQRKLATSMEWNALGYLFERLGDPEQAFHCYAKAIQLHLTFTPAHANLANLYLARCMYPEARCQYRWLSSLQPTNPIPLFQLAKIAEIHQEWTTAIELYQRCLQLNPNLYVAWNNLGWAHQQRADYAQAEKAYQKALQIHPNYTLSRLNWGNLLLQLGRFNEAEQQFYLAWKTEPDNCQTLLSLGNAQYLQSHWHDARHTYQHVLQLCPDHAQAMNNLAMVLALQNLDLDAKSLWESALAIDDQLAEPYINLIAHHEKFDDCQSAMQILLSAMAQFQHDSTFTEIYNAMLDCP